MNAPARVATPNLMNRRKPYWEMTTDELAEATKQFDDPDCNPAALKPTAHQRAQLRAWQRQRAAQRSTVTVALEPKLIEQADECAASHAMTMSELISRALRRVLRTKPAVPPRPRRPRSA
ncbi:MAG TPA: hypothetical protein VGM03_18980 [Phycisphaerae bacterium]